jgi:response regulator RpfG family c-di-GMP phosphodiesterase
LNDFLFGQDDASENEDMVNSKKPWHVLIVDDVEDIHTITKLVLSTFTFYDRPLEFHSAYSAAEAKTLLESDAQYSVAFIDVVMETTNAGLDLVKYIREELNNSELRIVLRTGQPSEAPEESVIKDYDINDYKNKTELTDRKLKTLMYSLLRSYRDIKLIQTHKAGLEQMINATMHFLNCDSLTKFASSLLTHVANILNINKHEIVCCVATNDANTDTNFNLLANNKTDAQGKRTISEEIHERLLQAHKAKSSIHASDYFVGYLKTANDRENYLYVSRMDDLEDTDHELLEFFAHNLAVAYDNILMREIVKQSQKEISYIIGEAVEKRSKETGGHVKRVAHYSYMLAILSGHSEFDAEIIKLASPLHDVGKIGIPDKILNKPAKLDPDEWEIMQTHAQIGYDILIQSNNEILNMGAIIAGQHHEKYDGTGYPNGLMGENIHIAGRITAIADVFDALLNERCYKPAWPLPDVINLLKEQKGKHFDPKLIDLLLDNLNDFLAIKELYPD